MVCGEPHNVMGARKDIVVEGTSWQIAALSSLRVGPSCAGCQG